MKSITLLCFVICEILIVIRAEPPLNFTLTNTRRILGGHDVGDTRPYMVYLRPTQSSDPNLVNSNWLCGGVIIHRLYVLSSAACIEDATHFVVISGTHRWFPADKTDECITNGAKRAVWKCVPKAYSFDGHDFDNIRWMAGDIAVIKVEDEFNFQRRIKGCDFVPKLIAFNNQSLDFEKPGTVGSIAGWGTDQYFADAILSPGTRQDDPKSEASPEVANINSNSPVLKETEVQLISKKNCLKRWDERYHEIINNYAICSKDQADGASISAVCSENEVNCKELLYSDEDEEDAETTPQAKARRMIIDPQHMKVHTSAHWSHTRRQLIHSGGFCENDHGGPLIVGRGISSMVIGIMMACQTKEVTQKCYGPYLFTSVYRFRNLLMCAIYKDANPTCRKYLSSKEGQLSETTYAWESAKLPKATRKPVAGRHMLRNYDSLEKSHDMATTTETRKTSTATIKWTPKHKNQPKVPMRTTKKSTQAKGAKTTKPRNQKNKVNLLKNNFTAVPKVDNQISRTFTTRPMIW